MGTTKDQFLRETGVMPGNYRVYLEGDLGKVPSSIVRDITGSFYSAASPLEGGRGVVAYFTPENKRDADDFVKSCKAQGIFRVIEGPDRI